MRTRATARCRATREVTAQASQREIVINSAHSKERTGDDGIGAAAPATGTLGPTLTRLLPSDAQRRSFLRFRRQSSDLQCLPSSSRRLSCHHWRWLGLLAPTSNTSKRQGTRRGHFSKPTNLQARPRVAGNHRPEAASRAAGRCLLSDAREANSLDGRTFSQTFLEITAAILA